MVKLPQNRGFSLVEMALVIVTIAIITAAIMTGTELVKQGEIRKVVKDADTVLTALQTFKLKYGKFPGDLDDATTFFSGTDNGNGDGQVTRNANSAGAGASEASRVFEHMSLAEIYPGNFIPANSLAHVTTPSYDMGPQTIRGAYLLVNDFTERGCCTSVNRNYMGGKSLNVLSVGLNSTNGTWANSHVGEGIFLVEEALLIDKKIDDGLARSGNFTGSNSLMTTTGNAERCLAFINGTTHDPALTAGGAYYNTGTNHECLLKFDIDF